MLQNRTTIRQATVFAAAMASACLPVTHAVAGASSTTQVIRLDDFRALRESAGWSALRAKLVRWKNLPSDWDGDESLAPTAETIDNCDVLLMALQDRKAPVPVATVAGDGEVTYEWELGQSYASASFTADGHIIAYVRQLGHADVLRIDEPFGKDAVARFLERITAFA